MPTDLALAAVPLVLLAGLVIGLFLGRRSAVVDQDEDTEREARREVRRKRLAELDEGAAE